MIRTQISYLPATKDVQTEFPRWVTQHCDDSSIVLDVGAGKGRTGCAPIIRERVARLIGIDPDTAVMQNPYIDEGYQVSIEDFAKDRSSTFDCLYTMFVLEHITNPCKFLLACRSLLKPDGMLFGVTPNLWHYFGLTAKLSASLGIDDWLLERLIGAEVKASYHFLTLYQLNSIRTITSTLAQSGFRGVEFRCLDSPSSFQYVFPRPFCWFPGFYSHLVYTLRLPQAMGLIMFRATA